MTGTTTADLSAAAEAVALADEVIGVAIRHLNGTGGPDANQVLAYDAAWSFDPPPNSISITSEDSPST